MSTKAGTMGFSGRPALFTFWTVNVSFLAATALILSAVAPILVEIILMCGGIHNTLIKGCTLDGTGVATDGISYEFGHHHYAGGAAGR